MDEPRWKLNRLVCWLSSPLIPSHPYLPLMPKPLLFWALLRIGLFSWQVLPKLWSSDLVCVYTKDAKNQIPTERGLKRNLDKSTLHLWTDGCGEYLEQQSLDDEESRWILWQSDNLRRGEGSCQSSSVYRVVCWSIQMQWPVSGCESKAGVLPQSWLGHNRPESSRQRAYPIPSESRVFWGEFDHSRGRCACTHQPQSNFLRVSWCFELGPQLFRLSQDPDVFGILEAVLPMSQCLASPSCWWTPQLHQVVLTDQGHPLHYFDVSRSVWYWTDFPSS